MAAFVAYRSSWTRDWMNLSHSLHHTCGNAGYFTPKSWAGNRTQASAMTWATEVRFLTHCATAGTPKVSTFKWTQIHTTGRWNNISFKESNLALCIKIIHAHTLQPSNSTPRNLIYRYSHSSGKWWCKKIIYSSKISGTTTYAYIRVG